jgi:alanine racemase
LGYSNTSRSAWISIDHHALRHNLQKVRQFTPNSQIMAVIKANAYGHGLIKVAHSLNSANGFAVASVSEALELRRANFIHPILVLQGYKNREELQAAALNNLRVVIHDPSQLALLKQIPLSKNLDIALKFDTGMHRLGFPAPDVRDIYQSLNQHSKVNANVWLMSHLACADELNNTYTDTQLSLFKQATQGIKALRSLANSAGIIAWQDTHLDWVRAGIMLYGASPILNDTHNMGLQAVMSLYAPIIAIHNFKKGDALGYASTWVCPEDMSVGVVACGYADGYPRHAVSGTPVWLNGKETQLIGRVSMDMIMIDLRGIFANIADTVELWGKQVSVTRVAQAADSIAYELLCHVGNQCPCRD